MANAYKKAPDELADKQGRIFDSMIFMGNGERSAKSCDTARARLERAFSMLSAAQQGADDPKIDEFIDNVVRDLAMALTGKEITFKENKPLGQKTYDARNYEPRFAVGEIVFYPKRQWWSLWLLPKIVIGKITEKHNSYEPNPCLCWLYKVDGVEKWCTEGYLLDYNSKDEPA